MVLISLFGISCGVRKVIPEGKQLLKSNKLIVNNGKVKSSELKAQILHRTNKRVLFNRLPVFLWIYALGTSNKHPELNDSIPWRKRFRDELGEAPVIYDEQLVKLSAENITNYMVNRGYFDAYCEYKVELSKRKAKVKYIANLKHPYTIKDVSFEGPDSALISLLRLFHSKIEPLQTGQLCNLNAINESREKLSTFFRDSGYFNISRESFRFEIDTFRSQRKGSIKIILTSNIENQSIDKFVFGPIKVDFETNPLYLNRLYYPDTIKYPGLQINSNRYPLNGRVIKSILSIDSGNYFSESKWAETYRRLVDLGIFSSVEIQGIPDYNNKKIDPIIKLKTSPRLSFTAEPQILYSPQGSSGLNLQTSTQRSFGLAGILSFMNKNVFGNGELFKLSSITSYEAIFKRDDITDIFTGIQQGIVATLKLPRYSFMDRLDQENQYDQQSTLFSFSYQFEKNQNFSRSSMPASMTLQFRKDNFSWYYTPAEISYNRNIIDPAFLPQLPALDQDFVLRVFTDQIITPTKIGFVYANNQTKPGQLSSFVRMGIETSGNWHRASRYLFEPNYVSDSSYKFLGVNYFQYSKFEAELRFKQNIDELNSIAFRINSGIAIPYGNSSLIPYDKRYFIGGSNSLRAWQPRTLGPGNTPRSVTSILDKSGEFLLELNMEYRFTIIRKLLESAIFLDAGNIWNLSRISTSNPDYGVLHSNTFLSEVALNTGIGFRFDLGIFLFRLDWGWPLRDPSLAVNQRWILSESINNSALSKYFFDETAIAIGIGYPF